MSANGRARVVEQALALTVQITETIGLEPVS
jgi:hypothetical protein